MTELETLAGLLDRRNAIDAEIAALTGRPPLTGHLGEWIAARVFDIQLEESAAAPVIDGRFRSGALAGQTVNVKCYGKREGILDMTSDPRLDHYLVLTGPAAAAVSSRGGVRPFVIAAAYVIDAVALLADLQRRDRKIGVASSVRREWWDRSEVFPRSSHPLLKLGDEQRAMLELFASG